MNLIGNILWLIFGGFVASLGYFFGGLILCLTIVGIPFGLQCFKIAGLVLMPFGKVISDSPASGGCLSLVCNVIWIFTGGFYTALAHLAFGIACCISIIGIPFGMQHFKLIGLSLAPFGKKIS